MSPTFSVVIPTYNQADFLRIALTSVLDQTFKDFEVIIVNNYSTDHTLDVVSEFHDPRVRSVDFKNNGVIGAARNVGIMATSAPYVSFLDSDDTWLPNKLERVAEIFKADPDVGLVCHNQDLIQGDRVARRTFYGPPPGFEQDLFGHTLLVCNGPATSATTVARRRLDAVGNFSENQAFVTAEDYDLWIRLAKVCRFEFLHDVLGAYNYHEVSASNNVGLHLNAAIAVLDEHCGGISNPRRIYSNSQIHFRYANLYYGAGRQHQRMGRIKKAFAHFFQSLKIHPFHRRAYVALALLVADMMLGQKRRKSVVGSVWPQSWRWG